MSLADVLCPAMPLIVAKVADTQAVFRGPHTQAMQGASKPLPFQAKGGGHQRAPARILAAHNLREWSQVVSPFFPSFERGGGVTLFFAW